MANIYWRATSNGYQNGYSLVGNHDGLWNNPSNWSGGVVPGASDTAIFDVTLFTPAKQSLLTIYLPAGVTTIVGGLTVDVGVFGQGCRVLFKSDSVGVAATISAGAVTLNYCEFMDIVGSGAATWSGTSIGDAGGNNGITFTSPVTRYWVGNGGIWDNFTTTNWSTSSGGTSGASPPLCHDSVIFDANSFSSSGQNVICAPNDVRLICAMDWTAVTNNPSFHVTAEEGFWKCFFGDWTFSAAMTLTFQVNYVQYGARFFWSDRGDKFLTIPTGTIGGDFVVANGTGTLILGNSLIVQGSWGVLSGTFDANDSNFTTYSFYSTGSLTRAIYMAGGTWTVKNAISGYNDLNNTWTLSGSNLTFDSGDSTLILDGTGSANYGAGFYGGGYYYNDVQIVNNYLVPDVVITITGDNNFNNLILSPTPTAEDSWKNTEFQLAAGSTQTVADTFTAHGVIGNLIYLTSSTPGTQAYISADLARVSFVHPTDNHALGAGILFDDRIGGIDGGNNTNWLFDNTVPNQVIQNVFLVASDPDGDVQMINLGKSDDFTPIYYELETQSQQFGNAFHKKKISDKMVVFSKDAGDSKVQIKADEADYKDVEINLDKRVNKSKALNIEGSEMTLKWFGNTKRASPILEGFYIEDIKDEGTVK